MSENSSKKGSSKKDPQKKGKAPPMKPACLVVKRIIHDLEIPRHFISVGYLDRFLGIIEKPFAAFCWDDFTSQDYYTFGVPEHRIQYFRYRRAVIWDKTQRIDLVFGSTGSQTNIRDLITNYRDEDYPLVVEEAGSVEEEEGLDDDQRVDDFDSDQSDEFNIIFDTESFKLGEKVAQADYTVDEDDQPSAKMPGEFLQDKLRPNFFLCQKITTPSIVREITRVQDHVCEQEPLYEMCRQAQNLLHTTICTLRIESEDELRQMIRCLNENLDEIQHACPKDRFNVKGLDRFFGRVLYAAVETNPKLVNFIDTVTSVLRSEGFRVMDQFEYVPHISLIKPSRPVARQLGHKNINPSLFRGLEQTPFGTFTLQEMHLCEMGQKRSTEGEYICHARFPLITG